MLKEEYYRKLDIDIFDKIRISGGLPKDAKRYFDGHRPRFDAQIAMWNDFLDKDDITRVEDWGTGVPFSSYYFYLTQRAWVTYGCPMDFPPNEINDRVLFKFMNLCYAMNGEENVDLLICTECLEHLPCNLYKVRDFLCSRVRSKGYMLLSFPIGRVHPSEYERDDMGNKDKVSDAHIREFSMESAHSFCKIDGWEVLRETPTFTKAYGGIILNVLLRRTI